MRRQLSVAFFEQGFELGEGVEALAMSTRRARADFAKNRPILRKALLFLQHEGSGEAARSAAEALNKNGAA